MTPPLLREPVVANRTLPRRVEVRSDSVRHLLECYDGWRVRCARADELGFRHPGVDIAIAELRRIAPAISSIFDGSIFEISPFSVEIEPGRRVARAAFNDVYRFGDVDLRSEPFDDRRALLEELATAFDTQRVHLSPLLRVAGIGDSRTAVSLDNTLHIVAR